MPTLQEYYVSNYSKCSKEHSFLSDWQTLAYVSHGFVVLLLPLYVFGGYCILYQTPSSMKDVKFSLLNLHFWCCVYDISVTSLMTPYFFFPLLAGFPVGFFGFLQVPVTTQLVISAIICYATLFSMTSVFENRYNIIRINTSSTSCKSTFNYILKIVLAALNVTLTAWNFSEQQVPLLDLLRQLPCPSHEFFEHPIFVISHSPPWKQFSLFLTVSTLSGEAFQIFYFCFSSIYFLFFASKSTLSSKTRRMQVRYFYLAILQISVPIFFLAVPFSYFCFSIFSGYYNQSLNNLFILFLPLHGMSGTLVILIIHQPYRDFMMSMICGRKQETEFWFTTRVSK